MAAPTISTYMLKAPWIMAKLRADFGLSEVQAAAILGNLGHESAGLTAFQEGKPLAGRGGWGWAQWTGPRRVAFEAYCKRNKLGLKSDKANYAWLFLELKGSHKAAIRELKKQTTLKGAVRSFESTFERAGVKSYASRDLWAGRALAAYQAANKGGLIPPPDVTPNSERIIEVKIDTTKLPPAGKVIGYLGAAGAIALAFGQADLAALFSKVTESDVQRFYELLTLGGGLLTYIAGKLPSVKST